MRSRTVQEIYNLNYLRLWNWREMCWSASLIRTEITLFRNASRKWTLNHYLSLSTLSKEKYISCRHMLMDVELFRWIFQKYYLTTNCAGVQVNTFCSTSTVEKMRAELANLNQCAVPFLKPRHRQLILVL